MFRFKFGWVGIWGCLGGEEFSNYGWVGGGGNRAEALLYWGLHPWVVHSTEVVVEHKVEMIGWLAGSDTKMHMTKDGA